MQKNSTLNKLIWAVVAIIVIVIITVVAIVIIGKPAKAPIAVQPINHSAKQANQGTYNAITDSTIYNSETSQALKEFPTGLIDTSNAKVKNGYHIVGKGYDQYTVDLTTTQSSTVMFDEYANTLSKSPYTLSSKQAATAKITTASIFASNGLNKISLTIAPDSNDQKTNDITISYEIPNPATAAVPATNSTSTTK